MTARLAVIIPAGPADDIVDTVSSVLHCTSSPRYVLVVDDTSRPVRSELEAMSPDIHVIAAPRARTGTSGGLWTKVAAGYRHVLEHAEFDLLLRLDADALLIGPGLAELTAERFGADSAVGMLGSNRLGMDGGTRDWSWPAAMLAAECGARGLTRPQMRATLRDLRAAALRNGYTPGEHPLGAAYFHSAAAVRELAVRGWLELPELKASRLGDDHLFGLLTFAAGFRIGELAGPDDPLALDWKRLPASPEELLRRGKLATHSVRAWDGLTEREIRDYFAERRVGPPFAGG